MRLAAELGRVCQVAAVVSRLFAAWLRLVWPVFDAQPRVPLTLPVSVVPARVAPRAHELAEENLLDLNTGLCIISLPLHEIVAVATAHGRWE